MTRRPRTAALSVLALVPAALAWQAATSVLTLEPESRLWVDGTSTVRSFTCKAGEVKASVEALGPGAATAVVTGTKAVTAVAVDVPAGRLDCSNGRMNEHMFKALKVEEHPAIAFRLSSYELAPSAAGQTVTLAGDLTLGGVTKPITMEASAAAAAGGAMRVTGKYALNMKEFGLKPPTLMMGTLKVNERVTVGYDLLLKD